jgi:hypothetical protein
VEIVENKTFKNIFGSRKYVKKKKKRSEKYITGCPEKGCP